MAEPIVIIDSDDEELLSPSSTTMTITTSINLPIKETQKLAVASISSSASSPQTSNIQGAASSSSSLLSSSSSSSSTSLVADTAVASAAEAATIEKEQMECPICLQTCIHPARLPCGHIFCFLCVKGVAYKNRRCAMCRREIPIEFLDHPELLYKIPETSATTEDGYQWFYEGRNGWWQYDERTSQEIEDAYKKGDKFCTILVAGYVYVVDFETLLQQRQNDPTRKRQVKRDLATTPRKGIAGLRIDGTSERSGIGSSSSSNIEGDFNNSNTSNSNNSQIPIITSSSLINQPSLPILNTASNNIILNIAAADAAIRIASDIIDSTLAHANSGTSNGSNNRASRINNDNIQDYVNLTTMVARDNGSGDDDEEDNDDDDDDDDDDHDNDDDTDDTDDNNQYTTINMSRTSSGSLNSHDELLQEVQETLNISNSTNLAPSSSSSSNSPTLNFLSSTINEFRSLALSNIAESSSDEEDEEQETEDDDNNIGNNDYSSTSSSDNNISIININNAISFRRNS